ncbi:FYVE-domain-containing protein [Wallemia mellicola]|uniref:FYVE-domain-containing protein n=1 Tax=Wallemia mellicola TaxID=1708541 RepID=A0A4T0SKX7_9BASI|nr:hypothetical protein E3Q24_03952 [Wallemia mellicola]TIB72457.1 hypothetical protein E3Q23_03376 [Wallemia mellicola]TIB76980.1 FYVE-domain-containing protein [Wallemia mellicola]TIB82231.1 FYVE-domain-containing protein [Wallemia mellicola]TIB84963.1 FYVE-domain-containing protein [Wallemia mellicola]
MSQRSISPSNSVKGFVVDHQAVQRVVNEKRSQSQPPVTTTRSSNLSPLVSRSNSPPASRTAVKNKNGLKLDRLPQYEMSNSNQSTPNLNNTDDEPWLSFIPSSTKQSKKAASKSTPIASTSSLDLAVESKPDLPALLPKSLWKPDSDSAECDIVTCSTSFNLLERRHHCRKCGGVFCQPHSSHSASLVDTTSCDYILPRKNDTSRNVVARVCDDCYQDLTSWSGYAKSMSSQSLAINEQTQPRTPQLCISPTSSSSISSPSSSLSKQQNINHQYVKMMTQQQQSNSYFVPPISTNLYKSSTSLNEITPPASNQQPNSGPLHSYVLASTSARQALGKLPAFTPPVTPSHSTYTSSLNIPINKSRRQENVIIDGDIKVKEQPAYSMGQSLAKSLTWAWSTF